MIIDKSLVLADGVSYSVWGNAGTYYAGCIDLTKTKTQIHGDKFLVVRMGTAAATGTSLAFSLITSTAAVTADDGTGLAGAVVLGTSGAIVTASLTANTNVWTFKIPDSFSGRYLTLKIVSAESTDFDAGTFDAYITDEVPLAAY